MELGEPTSLKAESRQTHQTLSTPLSGLTVSATLRLTKPRSSISSILPSRYQRITELLAILLFRRTPRPSRNVTDSRQFLLLDPFRSSSMSESLRVMPSTVPNNRLRSKLLKTQGRKVTLRFSSLTNKLGTIFGIVPISSFLKPDSKRFNTPQERVCSI